MKNKSIKISFRENEDFITKLKKYYHTTQHTKAIRLAIEEVLLKHTFKHKKSSKDKIPNSLRYRDKNKLYTITISTEILEALCLIYNTKNKSKAVQIAITTILDKIITVQKAPSELKSMYFMLGQKNKLMCDTINQIFAEVKDDCTKYAEAFIGTANVFYHSNLSVNMPCYINDKEPRTVNFLKVLRDNPLQLKVKLISLPYNKETFKKLKAKTDFEDKFDDAVAFLYTRYASILGEKKTFDPRKTYSSYLSNLNLLYHLSNKLKETEISKNDALHFIKKHNDCNVLLYLDPPYPYTEDVYANSVNHKTLANLLSNFKGKFVYSCRITFSNTNRTKGFTDSEMENTIDALFCSKGFYYIDVPLKNDFNEDYAEQIERLITNFPFEGSKEYK